MRILVDADACPVRDIITRLARERGIPVTMYIDRAHMLAEGYYAVVTVDRGRDAVDFALMRDALPGDIVVTQDYGLAALALGKGAQALSQDGLVFDEHNIDSLLMLRHAHSRMRRAGGRVKGPAKRGGEDDLRFAQALTRLLAQAPDGNGQV